MRRTNCKKLKSDAQSFLNVKTGLRKRTQSKTVKDKSKTAKMSNPQIGDCAFVVQNWGAYAGIWSVVVADIKHFEARSEYGKVVSPARDTLVLRYDGVVVPPSAADGVANPSDIGGNPLSRGFVKEDLLPRQPLPDDEVKRQQWITLVEARQQRKEAEAVARQKALCDSFAHVQPGLTVTWEQSGGWGPQEHTFIMRGTIVSTTLDKDNCHAVVQPTGGGAQVVLYLPNLTFL